MNRRTRSIVTAAASVILCSGVAFAQTQDRDNQGGRLSGGSAAGGTSGSMTQTDTQSGMQSSRMGEGREGREADRQIVQQLRSFAQDPNTAADKCFVLKAGCGNQAEIEFARAAEQKAQNLQVKQLAQQIQQDHQQAQQQLQQVAQQLGVQLPQSLPAEKQEELRLMQALPTDQFEKHYVCMMEADHAKDVTEYRATSQLAQNEQVKQYAQQTLPKLQQHYSHTQQVAVALGVPSGGPEAVPAAGHMQGDMNIGTTGSGDMNASGRVGSTTGNRTGTSGTGDTPPEHSGPTPDTRNPQR
jgi:putative membrane protein